MNGGQMVTVIEAPSANNPTQLGTLTVRNFSVHDESQLEQAVQQQGGPQPPRGSNNNNMDFSSMKVDFTRSQNRLALRDGVVRGPVLGGTIDGTIDYGRDELHLRGTLVPLYGANNLLGQIPVVGLFLGGDKEGLLGVTYEVVGKPGAPIMHLNPLSALAPGFLRKVFEYPAQGTYGSPPAETDDNAPSAFDDNPGGSASNGNR
jgi:AsmA-like C-terminal region